LSKTDFKKRKEKRANKTSSKQNIKLNKSRNKSKCVRNWYPNFKNLGTKAGAMF
jgi:hypothetical protein